MLGEDKTEQFIISTYQDGKLIREQRIHDPFIHSTTTIGISRWDLFKALFRKQFETKISVHVRGTWGAEQAIMMLDPIDLQRRTDLRITNRNAPSEPYCSDSENSKSAGVRGIETRV